MDRIVRTGAVAAGLLAALALTACGSDGDNKSDPPRDAASGASESATPGGGGDDGGSADAGATALEGTWAGPAGGTSVTVLSVRAGKAALVADQHVCQGEVSDMGKVMLALECTDGNTDRTMGSVESNDGKTIVISWDAGAKDTLTKTDPGKMPTGLPDLPGS